MRDNLDSLLRIPDKLYRRNPAERRKPVPPAAKPPWHSCACRWKARRRGSNESRSSTAFGILKRSDPFKRESLHLNPYVQDPNLTYWS